MDYVTQSALQVGEPVITYRKAVPSKVQVKVWNSITGRPEELILEGEKENSIVDLFSEQEVKFFKQINRYALENGIVVEFKKPKAFDELKMEVHADATDEDMHKLFDVTKTKYFAFRKWVRDTNIEAPLVRLLAIAREREESEKYIKLVEERISEIQLGE